MLSLNSDGKIRDISIDSVIGVNLDHTSKEYFPEEIYPDPNLEETPFNEVFVESIPLIVPVPAAPGQLWEKTPSKSRGYFTLKNPASGKYLTTSSSKSSSLYKPTLQGKSYYVLNTQYWNY